MDYSEFRNILVNNDFIMFDHDYRILFNNMKLLDKICISSKIRNRNEHNQNGGSLEEFDSPFNIIKLSKSNTLQKVIFKKKLKFIIYNLNSNNFGRAKFICNKNYCPKIY